MKIFNTRRPDPCCLHRFWSWMKRVCSTWGCRPACSSDSAWTRQATDPALLVGCHRWCRGRPSDWVWVGPATGCWNHRRRTANWWLGSSRGTKASWAAPVWAFWWRWCHCSFVGWSGRRWCNRRSDGVDPNPWKPRSWPQTVNRQEIDSHFSHDAQKKVDKWIAWVWSSKRKPLKATSGSRFSHFQSSIRNHEGPWFTRFCLSDF